MTHLIVNGRPVKLRGPSDSTLLTALRDELGLVGTRFGCGQGLCGACFVWLRGSVVPACQTPLWQVEEQAVTTVEYLSEGGQAHAVQQTILEQQAAQCGFCISGIIMNAAALLEREPCADRARIAEVLDRNLCRCGAHQRILSAVQAAQERL